MTMSEFASLLAKKRKLVIAIVLVFFLGGAGFGAYRSISGSGDATTAEASIIVNKYIDSVAALAIAESKTTMKEMPGVTIEVATGLVPSTVSLTATGNDPEECVTAINQLANKTEAEAESFLATASEDEEDKAAYSGTVVEANLADYEKSSGIVSVLKSAVKFGVVGLFGGAFVAVCVLFIYVGLKNSVRGAAHVVDETSLYVLDTLPVYDGGAKLLANIGFALNGSFASVCVIPVSDALAAKEVAQLVANTTRQAAAEGRPSVKVAACEPLSGKIDAAFTARKADATIVVVRQWDDSMLETRNTLAELDLAKAKVAGIVMCA